MYSTYCTGHTANKQKLQTDRRKRLPVLVVIGVIKKTHVLHTSTLFVFDLFTSGKHRLHAPRRDICIDKGLIYNNKKAINNTL